ncbi:MAG: hypothetical protein V7635_1402 [Arthrobacter sp.]
MGGPALAGPHRFHHRPLGVGRAPGMRLPPGSCRCPVSPRAVNGPRGSPRNCGRRGSCSCQGALRVPVAAARAGQQRGPAPPCGGDVLGPAIPGTGRLDGRPRASAATARTATGEGRRLVDRAYYVREPKYPFHHDIRPVLLTPLPLAEGTRCTGRCTVTATVWGGSCKYPVVKRRWHPAASRLRCFSKGFPRAPVGCLPPCRPVFVWG